MPLMKSFTTQTNLMVHQNGRVVVMDHTMAEQTKRVGRPRAHDITKMAAKLADAASFAATLKHQVEEMGLAKAAAPVTTTAGRKPALTHAERLHRAQAQLAQAREEMNAIEAQYGVPKGFVADFVIEANSRPTQASISRIKNSQHAELFRARAHLQRLADDVSLTERLVSELGDLANIAPASLDGRVELAPAERLKRLRAKLRAQESAVSKLEKNTAAENKTISELTTQVRSNSMQSVMDLISKMRRDKVVGAAASIPGSAAEFGAERNAATPTKQKRNQRSA